MLNPLRSRLMAWLIAFALAFGITSGLSPSVHAAITNRALQPATSCQTLQWRQSVSASQQASNQDVVTATVLVGLDPVTHEFCGDFQSFSSVTRGNGTGGSFVSTLILHQGTASTTVSSGLIPAYGSFTGNHSQAPCAQAQTTYFPNGGPTITVTTKIVCPQSV